MLKDKQQLRFKDFKLFIHFLTFSERLHETHQSVGTDEK